MIECVVSCQASGNGQLGLRTDDNNLKNIKHDTIAGNGRLGLTTDDRPVPKPRIKHPLSLPGNRLFIGYTTHTSDTQNFFSIYQLLTSPLYFTYLATENNGRKINTFFDTFC
jgi:hypothetical protein